MHIAGKPVIKVEPHAVDRFAQIDPYRVEFVEVIIPLLVE